MHVALQLDVDEEADMFPYSDIYDLPSREHYEAKGELLPRGAFVPSSAALFTIGDTARVDAGDAKLDLGAFGHPHPIPTTFGEATDVMTADQMVLRLTSMESVLVQLEAQVGNDFDLASYVSAAQWGVRSISQRLQTGEGYFTIVDVNLKPSDVIPEDPAALSKEIVRSELVLDRVFEAIAELSSELQQEEVTGGAIAQMIEMAGRKDAKYDLAEIRGQFLLVKLNYLIAANHVLRPRAVDDFNYADERHGQLEQDLLEKKVTYYENIRAKNRPNEKATDSINQWAGKIREDIAWLRARGPELRAAREQDKADHAAEAEFANKAAFVATSIEALAEYDKAATAYDLLASNSALWGYEDAKRIRWRLEQMRDAAFEYDIDYLKLLLRDHQKDEKVTEFYASIPSIIQYSQMIIMFVIMVIATIVTWGVGVGFALVTGITAENMVVLSIPFLIRTGLQAFAFTLISRQLQSMFPGMKPMSPFWQEFLWNFGMFGVMEGVGAAMRATLKTMGSFARFAVSSLATFEVLQVYGFVHALVEGGQPPSSDEIWSMTKQNLIMMVGMGIVMKGFSPMMQAVEESAALSRFNRKYGADFKSIETARAQLSADVAQRLAENPEATKEQLADLHARAEGLEADLKAVLERAMDDESVDAGVVRSEAADLFRRMERMSLPEVLQRLGFDSTIELMPTGRDGAWSFPVGKADVVKKFFLDKGYEVAEIPVAGGHVLEVNIPGKGRIQLVESTTTKRVVAPFSETELATARARNVEDASVQTAGGTRGRSAYDIAETPTQNPKTVGRSAKRIAPGLAAEGVKLESVSAKDSQITARLRVQVGKQAVDATVTIEVVPEIGATRGFDVSVHGEEAGYARVSMMRDANGAWKVRIEVDARLATDTDVQLQLRHELREAAGIIREATTDATLDIAAQHKAGVFAEGRGATEPTQHDRATAAEFRDLLDSLRSDLANFQEASRRVALRGGKRAIAARDAGDVAMRRLDAALESMGFGDPATRAAKTKVLLDILGETPASPVGRYVADYATRTEAGVVRRAALDRISAERSAINAALGPELSIHLAKRVPAGAIDPLAEALRLGDKRAVVELVRQHAAGRLTDAQLTGALTVEAVKGERVAAKSAEAGETVGRKRTYKARDAEGHVIEEDGLSKPQRDRFRQEIDSLSGEEQMQARFRRYRQKIENAEQRVDGMDYETWKANNPQLRESVQRGLNVEAEAVNAAGAQQTNNEAGQYMQHPFFDKATNAVVVTRPDGFVGKDVLESKYIAPESDSQVLYDSPQLRAQHDLAGKLKSKHRILMSSEDGSRLNSEPPQPRPSRVVAGKKNVVIEFYDPAQKRITHTWDIAEGRWRKIP